MAREPHLPEHLDYLRLRNQRPRSIRERRLAVLRNNRRIDKPLCEASRTDLERWQHDIAYLTPAGRHNEIVHTVQFIRWAHVNGHRPDDPTDVIIRPRHVHQQLPHPMSDADVGMALLSAPHPERAWIALGAFCGLRCVEIASLARNDVRDDATPPVLSIVGKGGKHRIVPLPDRVLAELHEAGMPARGYLWSRMDGRPGPPSAMRVSERINAHLHSLGISATAHALRHRFGTVLYRETHDILLVAQIMGHTSMDTTKGYVLLETSRAAQFVQTISILDGDRVNTLTQIGGQEGVKSNGAGSYQARGAKSPRE